jgi:hypothetical protein
MKHLFALLCLAALLTQPAMARNFSHAECPVSGNTQTKTYYLPSSHFYAASLKDNKRGDHRNCFKTEKLAKEAGYKKSRR